jgi:hypothetical protein
MANNEKKTARIVGALFLIAMVTSLVGAGLIETVLGAPDYLTDISVDKTQVTIGALLELINGIAVVGIAFMMFPILKKINEALAIGYVSFRIIEAVIIIAALITPLALVAVSQEFTVAGAAVASSFQTLGSSILAVRQILVGYMLGIFFSLGALIFYYLLYQSTLVPRFISIWGLIAVVLVFTWNLLGLIGISIEAGIIFGLPIILNEIFLGIWLIAKGFNSSASDSGA